LEKLNNEELIVLAKEGNKEAYEFFFSKNDRFNYHIARKYSNVDNLDDLVSLSRIGMLKAYNKFDPSKGVKFITYASRIMINEILMHNRKIKKHKFDVSMDAPISRDEGGNELTIVDILEYEEDYDRLENQEFTDHVISDFQKNLKPKEKIVFNEMILGSSTQVETGKKINLSQSYASRIKTGLIKKLQNKYGNGEVKVRKSLVEPGEFKYAVNNYPELSHTDLARIFNVSTPTIANNFKRLKAGKFDENIAEAGDNIKEKLKKSSEKRLAKKKKVEEKKEDKRMLDILNAEEPTKLDDMLKKGKERYGDALTNLAKEEAKEKEDISKEEIIILKNKISNTSNRDEAAEMIYGLYQMIQAMPKDSKVKMDIIMEVVK
jgi:RNA polymerase sporulation-specific sigma factor